MTYAGRVTTKGGDLPDSKCDAFMISPLMRELVAASGEFDLEARDAIVRMGLDGERVTYVAAAGSRDGPQLCSLTRYSHAPASPCSPRAQPAIS